MNALHTVPMNANTYIPYHQGIQMLQTDYVESSPRKYFVGNNALLV